jgi:ergothioneine biosynthesis protein EgtB
MIRVTGMSGAQRRSPKADTQALLDRVMRVREATLALAEHLSPEDQTVQSMPDASPTKWHLAHTTWFWETFVLGPNAPGYEAFDPRFAFLFNSYYEALGERHARSERGLITRPDVAEVRAYRRSVDEALAAFAEARPADVLAFADLVTLGIAHEEQHQELLLTDIKHAFSKNPFPPAAYPAPERAAGSAPPLRWIGFEGGETRIGAEAHGFAFDNERPRHRALLESFELASRPATNREYLAFIADGGYDAPALWLSDGWALRQAEAWERPIYWRRNDDDRWREITLHGLEDLDLDAPVSHLSYFEASAFAEWSGARLPEEREWEHAAAGLDPRAGRFMTPGVSAHPLPASEGDGLRQMFGDVWEWTRSSYSAYPRYRPPPGAVGEYNGKFMCGQFVLRGGSCATPQGHVRATYRNFFPPSARWQFSGVRLARDP